MYQYLITAPMTGDNNMTPIFAVVAVAAIVLFIVMLKMGKRR